MTVKELIRELETHNPDLIIKLCVQDDDETIFSIEKGDGSEAEEDCLLFIGGE